jgi:hypothetical protein
MNIPYPRIPRNEDARIKLSDEQKNDIKLLYQQGCSVRGIARKYEGIVCKRTIQYILFPERLMKVKEHRKGWIKEYNKNIIKNGKHAQYMKKHRDRKYKINGDEYREWRKATR